MTEELKEIIGKSHCLFMKYGIRSVTMDDVARELGISKKTLYQHVEDKNDLVEKVFEIENQCTEQDLIYLTCNNLNAIDQILEVDKLIMRLMKDHNPAAFYDLKKYFPSIYSKQVQLRREKIAMFFGDNIEQGKTEGLYRDDVDSEIIARLHVARFEVVIDGDLFTVEEFTSGKWVWQLLNYHIRGLITPQGLEYFENRLKDYKSQI